MTPDTESTDMLGQPVPRLVGQSVEQWLSDCRQFQTRVDKVFEYHALSVSGSLLHELEQGLTVVEQNIERIKKDAVEARKNLDREKQEEICADPGSVVKKPEEKESYKRVISSIIVPDEVLVPSFDFKAPEMYQMGLDMGIQLTSVPHRIEVSPEEPGNEEGEFDFLNAPDDQSPIQSSSVRVYAALLKTRNLQRILRMSSLNQFKTLTS